MWKWHKWNRETAFGRFVRDYQQHIIFINGIYNLGRQLAFFGVSRRFTCLLLFLLDRVRFVWRNQSVRHFCFKLWKLSCRLRMEGKEFTCSRYYASIELPRALPDASRRWISAVKTWLTSDCMSRRFRINVLKSFPSDGTVLCSWMHFPSSYILTRTPAAFIARPIKFEFHLRGRARLATLPRPNRSSTSLAVKRDIAHSALEPLIERSSNNRMWLVLTSGANQITFSCAFKVPSKFTRQHL